MGLFDFAQDIGAKIFGDNVTPESQADKIKRHIETDNPAFIELSKLAKIRIRRGTLQ